MAVADLEHEQHVEPPQRYRTVTWKKSTAVRSTRGALPVFPPVGFPEPPPAPAVPVSEQRALHKPRFCWCGPHPVTGHAAGMAAPR